MDISMNIFDNPAFSSATMTSYVNTNVPFVPGFLGSLGIFVGEGVYTKNVMFDEENGALTLIKTSPRGSAPEQSQNTKGTTRMQPAVRLAREVVINADEVFQVRELGTAGQLRTLERLITKRVEGPVGLKASLSLTLEHMYLGAIDGQVLDADGTTTIYNYFDFYGISRPAALNVVLTGAGEDDTPVLKMTTALKRQMVRALSGMAIPAGAMPVILCGDNYFDAIWTSPELVVARRAGATGNDQALAILGDNRAFGAFIYGSCLFVNYRGTDDGSTVAVPTDEGRAFMRGVPGLFPVYFAPADTFEFVNTEGLPSYLIQRRERQTESQRTWELQSNPLVMCLRPQSLRRLTKS